MASSPSAERPAGLSGTALPSSSPERSARLTSLDSYRGLVMFLMMGEVLRFEAVARALPGSTFWRFLAFNQEHVEWVGCSLHDLIQPSFSFLVGVALPFSIASRVARGQSAGRMNAHALSRAVILVLFGVFLRSTSGPQTYWTFEDTLTQIGLGYFFLFLVGPRSTTVQWTALVIILTAYWAAWALYPLPAAGFDYTTVGVPADWAHHPTGFAAHWDKNTNLGTAFDQWFLNLFPRVHPFVANHGGYLTLSFIPTLGTMILGLIAGGWLKGRFTERQRVQRLLIAGLAGVSLGLALDALGICPLVKRIWTPTWTIFSGGCCCLLLAAFYWVIDRYQYQRWAFPLVVIGMNSIAAYTMAHLLFGPISNALKIHLGPRPFLFLGETFAPLLEGAAVLGVAWLILFWMYRRRIFLRI